MSEMVLSELKPPVEPCSRLTGLPTYVFAWLDELKEVARARGADLIDLGIGNPDRPWPPLVVEAVQAALADQSLHGYPPFKGSSAFKHSVARWMQRRYGVTLEPESQVLALSGSKEGLAHLTNAYIGEGDVSLVPDIYYPVHARATWLSGGQVEWMPLTPANEFLPDFSNIPTNVAKKAKLMFLNYPNNPTGATATLDFYKNAVAFCREHHIILVSDLAYGEITYDGFIAPSVFQVPEAMQCSVEFHSFSKTFNMAGSRLGFAVGNPAIIKALYGLRTNVGYGTPATFQQGGAVALDHAESLIPDIVAGYQKRRDIVTEGFRKLGWAVTSTKGAMYIWLPVPKGFTSAQWSEHLIDKTDVVVSPGNAFGPGGEGFFRISLVANETRLQEAIDRLAAKNITYQ